MCESEFTNADFVPSAVIDNVTQFLINQFLGMQGALVAVVAVCLLISSLSGKWGRVGTCLCAIAGILVFVLLAVSVTAWAIVPIKYIDTYEDFASSRDAVWGYISMQNIGPVWVAEFGEESPTTHWNWTIKYLRERDLDFAYWSIDGEHFPSAAVDLGHAIPHMKHDENYGLLLGDYESVRHTWKLKDLQSLMEAKPSGSDEQPLSNEAALWRKGRDEM